MEAEYGTGSEWARIVKTRHLFWTFVVGNGLSA